MMKFDYRSIFESVPLTVSAILSILLIFFYTISFISPVHQWGDTSTYYMQIQSIAEDRDIQYLPIDIERVLETRFDDVPAGLFLIKTEDGNYFYGKEYSYALFASQFYKLFGNNGILLFNAMMFYAMILMGYLYLRKYNDDLKALCVSIAFFFMSTAFVYNFWIHPEIYNMFLITLAFFLWILYINNNKKDCLLLASIIIGIAAVAKIPNIVLLTPIVLYELYKLRFKNFAIMVFTISLVLITFYGYFYMETGLPSFYGGNRLGYVSNKYPFIDGYDELSEAGTSAFSVTEGRIGALINTDNLKSIPYNVFYYFFGRFTGMMWYYPLAIFALMSVLIRLKDVEYIKSNPERLLILIGIISYILFFVIVIGNNYLGGNHAVGNRYFYVYPAFLFLLGIVKYRILIPFLLLAVVTVAPIIADPIENSVRPELHTFNVPYKYFPLEYSQLVNLPLWALAQRGEIYEIYALADDRKDVDYIIKTNSEVNSLDFVLWTYYNDNTIGIKANNYANKITLDVYEAKMLTIDDISPEYNDKRGYIYKISVKSDNDAYLKPINRRSWTSDTKLIYGPGWHGLEDWGGVPTRWMGNNATFLVYSEERQTAELDLKVLSHHHPRTLEIYLNGRPWIQRSDLPAASFVQVKATPMELRGGTNIITFYVPEGCVTPIYVTRGKNSDRRCLSLAFQDIRLMRDILIIGEKFPAASLASGWNGIEDWGGTPARWMENDALLVIEAEENRTAELSFTVLSYNHPRSLEVYDSSDRLIGKATVSPSFAKVEMPVYLEEGANAFRLHVPEGCEVPREVTGGESPDGRCLSLALQEIKII